MLEAPPHEQVGRAQLDLGEGSTRSTLAARIPSGELAGPFGVDDDTEHAQAPGTPPMPPESQIPPSDCL